MPNNFMKLSFFKLHITNNEKVKQVSISVDFDKENNHNSFKQKIKNQIANFYGESILIPLYVKIITIKLNDCSKLNKTEVLTQMTLNLNNISFFKQTKHSTKKQNYLLHWVSTPINQQQDESNLFQTNLSMSQITHQLFSQQMINRKCFRKYSVQTKDSSQEYEAENIRQSQITFNKHNT